MSEKTDQRSAAKNYLGRCARRKIINNREGISIFPDMPEICESFLIFATSLKFEQVSGRNGNVCVESLHNGISKIFGIINADTPKYQIKSNPLEKKSMKSIIKLALVVCLFSSVVLAEGDMGSGGKTCTNGTTTCLTTNQPTDHDADTKESTDSVLTFVQKYLESIFKYFGD